MSENEVKLAKIYTMLMGSAILIGLISLYYQNTVFSTILLVWFVIDYFYRLIRSTNKWTFIFQHPLDALAILPFSHGFRIFGLYRLMSLISKRRLLTIQQMKITKIFKANNLFYLIGWLGIVLSVSSFLVMHIEDSITTYAEGLWWSIVTTTTVGYGDIVPHTALGRGLAILLMLLGIGAVGLLTSNIVAVFSKNEKGVSTEAPFESKHVSETEKVAPTIMSKLDVDTYNKFLQLHETTQQQILQRLREEIDFQQYKQQEQFKD